MVSPWKLDERALRRWVTVAANVVLPEPGMPETAIRRRSLGGIVWSFAGLSSQRHKLSAGIDVFTPGLLNQSIYLVLHLIL